MKKAVLVTVLLLCCLALAGCGNEQDGISTDFAADTVFTVGSRRISLPEWYLYALPITAEAESTYGHDIWSYIVDDEDTTMGEAMKEDIRERITYVQIVRAKAEEYGIELNEDDIFDVNLQTEEYYEKLTPEQIEKYGITPEIIREIYSDNLLAMKVYENLTFNIDTAIPDEEVRHMVLQYIVIPKYREGEDETREYYSPEELEDVKSRAQQLLDGMLAAPDVKSLSQADNESFTAIELTADLATLKEKLPEELAEKAFAMRQDEINGLYDTEDAWFILDCIEQTNEEATDKARVKIIEQRQKDLFSRLYSEWEKAVIVKLNYTVWDTIEIK